MLAKDGFLDLEEVMDIPGFPGIEVLNNKKCVVIECKQNIPCNPCESACPHHASCGSGKMYWMWIVCGTVSGTGMFSCGYVT